MRHALPLIGSDWGWASQEVEGEGDLWVGVGMGAVDRGPSA